MKKLFSVLAAVMLILCACAQESSNTSYAKTSDYFIMDYNDCFQFNNGELYLDTQQRLHFVDFSSVTDAVICPKPNCRHIDESCSAFGMDNHPVIVDDSIYYFEDNTYYEGDKLTSSLNVYKAALDGTGRVKIDTIDGITMRSSFYSVFGNSVLYFYGMNEHTDDKPFGVRETYLCGYNFKSKKLVIKEFLCEGYSDSVYFCGELGGELYFILSYQSEKGDWMAGDTEEAGKHNAAELRRVSIDKYKKLNLETLELTDWELPEKIVSAHEKRESDPNAPILPIYAQIKEGTIIYSDCVDTLIVSPVGKQIFIEGYNGNDKAVVNGYIFDTLSTGECKVRRLSNGKEVSVTIAKDNVKAGYVAGYIDGKYIIRYFDFDLQQSLYFAVGGDELGIQ